MSAKKYSLLHRHAHIQTHAHRKMCSTASTTTKQTARSKKRITNYRATEILKSLHHRKQSIHFDVDQHNTKIVDKGLQIYHKIDEDKNDFAVHEVLKLCLKYEDPHKIVQLWDGIKGVKGISFPLIIECCIASMKTHHHHDAYIKILHELEGLIDDTDLISKTALIHAYSHTTPSNALAQRALAIFTAIPQNTKDNISVGAIIKCLIKHNLSRQALQIYDEQNTLQLTDNVSHLLAFKACMNCHVLFICGHQGNIGCVEQYDIQSNSNHSLAHKALQIDRIIVPCEIERVLSNQY
eukprot:957050_1